MKLLIITQKIDRQDDVLGFFYVWIKALAKHVEKIHAICLYKGKVDNEFPAQVYSLGKESGVSRLRYVINFYIYIWRERKNYDSVLVHMNQIYVILGWPIWKLFGKKVFLWYAHGSTSLSLRIAHTLVDGIITSTKEGFRIPSEKTHIVGQGIEVKRLQYKDRSGYTPPLRIVSVGRLSPVKKYEVLLDVAFLLGEKVKYEVFIAGGADSEEQKKYQAMLQRQIDSMKNDNAINLLGSIPYEDISRVLEQGDVFINASETGSLDKSGLEALSVGLPLFTCNEAYVDLFREHAKYFMFTKGDAFDASQKIYKFLELGIEVRKSIMEELRKRVEIEHSLESLSKKIIEVLSK